MIDTAKINDRMLIESLASTTCPIAGCRKSRKHTFCGGHYHGLPGPMKKALYNLISTGKYKPAVIEAMNFHGAKEFIMPPPPGPAAPRGGWGEHVKRECA